MGTCAICLGATQADADYHKGCIESLFGTADLPAVNVTLGELHRIAAKMAGKMSISGLQEKISLKLSSDKARLDLAAYCNLPERAAKRIIGEQIEALEPSLTLVSNSFLPDELKDKFRAVIQGNTAILTA